MRACVCVYIHTHTHTHTHIYIYETHKKTLRPNPKLNQTVYRHKNSQFNGYCSITGITPYILRNLSETVNGEWWGTELVFICSKNCNRFPEKYCGVTHGRPSEPNVTGRTFADTQGQHSQLQTAFSWWKDWWVMLRPCLIQRIFGILLILSQ